MSGFATSSEATFPVTMGPDLTFNGSNDAFVAKVKADGTGLVYAGYVGGSANDFDGGVAVDSVGNAYVTGWTSSSEATFPVTMGPDLSFNGGSPFGDAFVVKVTVDGTALEYAGYLGGSGSDLGFAIAVDRFGNAYVTGRTPSADFPVTVGPDLAPTPSSPRSALPIKSVCSGTPSAGSR